jgi:VanZ family protein
MVSLSLGRGGRPPGVLVLGILLAYGAADEWTQLLVNRSCELADWYADAAGAAAGVVAVSLLVWLASPREREEDRVTP